MILSLLHHPRCYCVIALFCQWKHRTRDKPRNPCLSGRLSTVNLLVLTLLDWLGNVSTVRWLSVDRHSVDGYYVVCHLGRITIRNDSYVARLLGHVVIVKPYKNVTYVAHLLYVALS